MSMFIDPSKWKTKEVTDWLKGLDDNMNRYVYSFTNNQVNGQQLLHIRSYELEQLGMKSIGHQEIVLEGVESLRNFHYNIDRENLQYLALQVATSAKNLTSQLRHKKDSKTIETEILNDITRTVAYIKRLISWLDYAPFRNTYPFSDYRQHMLKFALELATSAQRDRFVENLADQIRNKAENIIQVMDIIIQDKIVRDPIILQPASLTHVTLKKRESELGFQITTTFQGVHRISELTFNSPARNSSKIHEGDEIVQINYQTVIGWKEKNVWNLLRDSPQDVLLVIKKQPKHEDVYMQSTYYQMPAKRRQRWNEIIPIEKIIEQSPEKEESSTLTQQSEKTTIESDNESICSDLSTPTDVKPHDKEVRMYLPKPSKMLQRRNTICGDDMSICRKVAGDPLAHDDRGCWDDTDPSSPSLRDKSVSFGFGLEFAPPRPTTCLGISTSNGKFRDITGCDSKDSKKTDDKSKPGVSKVVRFDSKLDASYPAVDEKYICNVEDTIIETFEPIPFADEEEDHQTVEVQPTVQAINLATIARRGRLDKSHSTPAYDNTEEDEPPPAIEPRKESSPAPPPPPRPKKQPVLIPPVVPPHQPKPINVEKPMAVKSMDEIEVVKTPSRKSLTLSLMSRRRRIPVKDLDIGTIRGNLYRRKKNKQGVLDWVSFYFVLIESVLYGYKTKTSSKAKCFFFLPGFTVSLAKEIHSRQHAFKIYHPSETFHFAAESQEKLVQWMEFLQQAAKCSDSKKLDVNPKELYSDSENSEDEVEMFSGLLNKDGIKPPDTPNSSIHDYFGSLRKLTAFKYDKKTPSDVPVPTNDFKTFRRVPGGSGGLQIGANINVFYEGSHPPPTPVKPNTPPPLEKKKHTTVTQSLQPPEVPAPKPVLPEKTMPKSPNQQKYKKLINHIHASNPNLVDIDFSISKTFDYTLPKMSQSNIWETSTKEMVTLKDLMLQQQEEESREMYNHRVHLGVEKKNSNPPRPEKPENLIINKQFNKIQARSLPKTPDYEMSFKPDDKEIKLARTEEGQKLRDFGYEFIHGDEPSNQPKQYGSHRKPTMPNQVYPLEKSSSNSSSRTGSFKKKGKFEQFKASSERILPHLFNSTTLPSKKSQNILAGSDGSQTMKKSITYQNEFKEKDKKYEAQRKNSAPITVLSKLSFSGGDKHIEKKPKEKKFLGSPRFHRAIFGRSSTHNFDKQNQFSAKEMSEYDNEIFYPINLPVSSSHHSNELSSQNPTTVVIQQQQYPMTSSSSSNVTTPEYPDLQCPPVFEPETYSLSDPNASISLMRKQRGKDH